MAISKEKFLGAFLDELRENLLAAENRVIQLKNDPDNADALGGLLRTLHTMKGATRMLQFKEMETLVHGAESVFKGVRDGRYPVDLRLTRFFFLVADRLREAADALERGGDGSVRDLERFVEACDRLEANEAFDLTALGPVAADEAASAVAASAAPASAPAAPTSAPSPGTESTEGGASGEAATAKGQGSMPSFPREDIGTRHDASIRVDSDTIDRAISHANTLTIRQLRMRSAAELLESLEKRLVQSYRTAQDPKSLRKELATLTRAVRGYRSQFGEQLFEIERSTEELRDTVVGMRMLPLSTILERLPRMVEEAAAALGKDVAVSIKGDAVRVDSAVLAKLSDPLIHLVRNAVDHGIEAPAARERAGKPRRGQLRIECRTESSRVTVTVADDGAGLDYATIRVKALALWPEEAAAIGRMADEDLVRLLFRPGFTTRASASALSGRGVGLDIVKTNVEEARGQVVLESSPGAGCVFTLILPVSASTMDGMFVLTSGRKYFVPATAIAGTMLADADELFAVREKEMLTVSGVNIPVTDLALALHTERAEKRSRKLPLLLVRGPAETVGIAVERIIGYDSLVYQQLPAGLRRNPMIQGVVFDESFNIVPILNMGTVLDELRSVRTMDTHRRFSSARRSRKPSVLVADDSASTREILVTMLELEGYDVTGAVDGMDALKRLQSGTFDLVVSDLNMPRMDGLKLLENIRSDEERRGLPVIIVTTVAEADTRKRAKSLGANRYILKSSFDQDDLVDAVRELLARDTVERRAPAEEEQEGPA